MINFLNIKKINSIISLFLIIVFLSFRMNYARANSLQCRQLFVETHKSLFQDLSDNKQFINSMEIGKSIWRIITKNSNSSFGLDQELGTIFFISSHGHFIANRKIFEAKLKALENKGMINLAEGYSFEKGAIKVSLSIAFTLRNDVLNITKEVNEIRFFLVAPKNKNDIQSDFIVGKFEMDVSNWLPLQSMSAIKGESIYGISYPKENIQVGDSGSSYGTIKISSGKIIDIMDLSSQQQKSVFYISDIPIAAGVAGSPVFNSKGEVIGFITGSIATNSFVTSDSKITIIQSIDSINKSIKKANNLDSILNGNNSTGQNSQAKASEKSDMKKQTEIQKERNEIEHKRLLEWLNSPELIELLDIKPHLKSSDPYEVLNISKEEKTIDDAQLDKLIKSKYRKAIGKFHTDKLNSLASDILKKFDTFEQDKEMIYESLVKLTDGIATNINTANDKISSAKMREKFAEEEIERKQREYESTRYARPAQTYSSGKTYQSSTSSSSEKWTSKLNKLSLEKRIEKYKLLQSEDAVIAKVVLFAKENFAFIEPGYKIIKEIFMHAPGAQNLKLNSAVYEAFLKHVVERGEQADKEVTIGLVKLMYRIGTKEAYHDLNLMVTMLTYKSINFREFSKISDFARGLLEKMKEKLQL